MAGFSQQAGIMCAQIFIQSAVQTRAFQNFVSLVASQQEKSKLKTAQTIGFVQHGDRYEH
jgi:ABC-type sulfate transport system permease component